jgi:hypothetical protein
MAKPGLNQLTTSQTFQAWFDKTNEVISIIESDAVTASALGDTTIGNATLVGSFSANTIVANTTLRADVVSPRIGSTTIGITAPISVTSTSQNLQTLSSALGPRVQYTSGVRTWSSGFFDNTTNSSFIIDTGTGDPKLALTPSGNLTAAGTITATGGFIGSVTGNITGDITGNVTGNLSGDVTGNLTGNVTGNLTGNVTGNLSGNISGGNITSSGTVNFTGATVSNGGSVTTIAINGGTINNTSIGASTASTGRFTNATITGSLILGATAISVSAAEINHLANVSSNIQTQLNNKQPLDNELTVLSSLTAAANKIPMFSGSSTATLLDFRNESNLASNSATAVPSQQSVKSYVDNNIIGINQTWQDVTASRNAATNYTNSTGKPIYVSIICDYGNVTGSVNLTVSGIIVQRFLNNPDSSAMTLTVATIVPAGAAYRCDVFNGSITTWAELR